MPVATIRDVAARAQVSVMTVSRVLNGERYVSEDKRARVLAAVDALGFRRNQSARGLPGARTYVLVLAAGHIPSYVAALQRGVIRQCRRDDYHLVMVSTGVSGDDPVAAMRQAVSTVRADGIILLPPLANNPVVLDLMEAAGRAYVRVAPDDQLDRAPSVRIDEVAAGRAVTRHLLDLGHRRIGFIGGPADHGGAARRYQGYAEALAERGLAVEPDLLAPGDFAFAGGLAAAQTFLGQAERPTAIFASNDYMALGAMSAALRAGLSVPGDLAVAGFDDSEGARQSWPLLTTVRQPMEAMGEVAAELLIARAGRADAPLAARLLDYELVVRGSTAPEAGGAVEPRMIKA